MKNKTGNLFKNREEGLFLTAALFAWVIFQSVIIHFTWPVNFFWITTLEAIKTVFLSWLIFRIERKIFNHWSQCPFSKIIFFRVLTYVGLAVGAAFFVLFLLGGISFKRIFIESLGNTLFLFTSSIALDAARLIGRFPINKLVLGKYHRPKEERRIFLFIDLKESTRLSLDLGTIQFSYLIKEFFKDIDWAAQRWKGEIYQYAGDQVIISWLVNDRFAFIAAINTFISFYYRMMGKRSFYRDRFGAAPSFKAALHEGSVITTWVGHSKREIVYQGDVLNITARLTDLAKNLNYPIVLSENIARQIMPKYKDQIIHGGDYTIKGVEDPVPVYFFVLKKQAAKKEEEEEMVLAAS